jgi:hypothetical protein
MNLTLNLALWIVAGLLAAVLLVSSAKLFVPKEKMAGMGAATRWVEDFSPGALKAIGALELLAAAGLILPAALDIAPVLVPLAAYRCCAAVCRRGDHAPPPWREGNDRGRPGLSRPGRLRGLGPLRPRALHRLTSAASGRPWGSGPTNSRSTQP